MHRLFIGLRPPREMRDQLLAIMSGIDGARWQDEDQLHLTLRYIGEVERPIAEDIALSLTALRASAFTLRLTGVGRFGSRGRVNAVWAGVTPTDAVTMLHRKIDHHLVMQGLAPEARAYLPHITLARMNLPEPVVMPYLAVHAGLDGPEATFSGFLLYESHLGSGGARYEEIARYPLR